MAFLNKEGLSRLWAHVNSKINTAVNETMPKLATVELLSTTWEENGDLYSQTVTISEVGENSKIDLQPTAQQVVLLQNEEISLMAGNDAGAVTIYAIGGKPSNDYTMQVLITEVNRV